jgi:hypothetical protein
MLINSTTNLNKLKFTSSGGDRFDQGKSGQPYIVKQIPGADGTFLQGLDETPSQIGGVDSLLRGGLLALESAGTDVSRLTKMLFDTKSSNGFEFIAKQNVLSRNNVKTEASTGAGYGGGGVNQGVYLPTNTLIQTGLAPLATGASNLFGLLPVTNQGDSGPGINSYFEVIRPQTLSSDSTDAVLTNRLVSLQEAVTVGEEREIEPSGIQLNVNGNVVQYGGGPGSTLGIGNTNIGFADQRTGANSPSLGNIGFYSDFYRRLPMEDPSYAPSRGNYDVFKRPPVTFIDSEDFFGVIGPQGMGQPVTSFNENIFSFLTNNEINLLQGETFSSARGSGVYPGESNFTVIDNSAQKAANFKVAGGPNIYGALNSSSPTLQSGIYGGTNEDNDKIKKGNIFVSGSTVSGVYEGIMVGIENNRPNVNQPFTNFGIRNIVQLGVNLNEKLYETQPDGAITNNFNVFKTPLISDPEYLKGTFSTDQTVFLSYLDLINKPTTEQGTNTALKNPSDFRKPLVDALKKDSEDPTSSILSISPDYVTKNKNRRVNQGDPGLRKNVFNYALPANDLIALDQINALNMYESDVVNTALATNDLCKFRIAVINNDKADGTATYIHFRAFIDAFSDNYNADWGSVKYVGRAEELYTYEGFNREVSLDFTVYAQSKAELIPMYKKLNYLASTLAPDYNGAGFMRGNFVRLTVGGYLYEQPGIIMGLNYTVPMESTWEIAIDEEGNSDSSVKELPHMIKVTGMTFKPIQKFIPAKANSITDPTQKYIALANNGSTTNYSDVYAKGDYKQNGAVIE